MKKITAMTMMMYPKTFMLAQLLRYQSPVGGPTLVRGYYHNQQECFALFSTVLCFVLFRVLCFVLFRVLCLVLFRVLCLVLFRVLYLVLFRVLCFVLFRVLCFVLFRVLCLVLFRVLYLVLFRVLCFVFFRVLCFDKIVSLNQISNSILVFDNKFVLGLKGG